MSDHNRRLRDAIYPTGLECSEEPMRKDMSNQAFATWRKTGERTLFSSGFPRTRYTRFLIEAYLQPADRAQEKAEALKDSLRAHGFEGVREINRAYDALLSRRVLTLAASLREELA